MSDQPFPSQIITVAEREIGGELIQTVNARDLYDSLYSDSPEDEFAEWASDYPFEHGFTSEVSYVPVKAAIICAKYARNDRGFSVFCHLHKQLSADGPRARCLLTVIRELQ